jgi:hypothetical protein
VWKNHPLRTFVVGLVLGLVCAGVGVGYLYLDAEGTSAEIARRLAAEQQRSAGLVDTIDKGLTDTIRREQATQGLLEKNNVLLDGLRKIINALPNSQ